MKRITIAVLAGLTSFLAACGGGTKELQYGAAQPPSVDEQAAAGDAEAALAATVAGVLPSDPTVAIPGLGDQLLSTLGGAGGLVVAPPAAQARRVLGRTMAVAPGLGELDPACMTITPTAVTWTSCVVTMSDVDPITGDTMDMTLHLAGTLSTSPATGVTTWDLHETLAMTMTSGGETMVMNGTMGQAGTVTVTASTIKGHTGSTVNATATYMGMSATEAVTTTLDLDLGYLADPFCIGSGTLRLEQVWARRPAGATPADLPDQGWLFEWTGCGAFTVSHGG